MGGGIVVPRRGMIRPISGLPGYGSQSGPLVEVEAGGAFYNAPYAAGASFPPQSMLTFNAPLSANFNDLLGHAVSTVGTAPTISGGKTVFGGAGGLLYAISPAGGGGTEGMQIRNAMHTIEGWFSSTTTTTNLILLDTDTTASGAYTLLLNLNGTVGRLAWLMNAGSASVVLQSDGWTNNGTRHHVAVVAYAPTYWGLYVDGVLAAESNAAVSMLSVNTSHGFSLGCRYTSSTVSLPLVGTMDNWRWTRGAALYTASNFTVPTPPFATS